MRENATIRILFWTTQNPSRSYILTKTSKQFDQFDKKVLHLDNFKTLSGVIDQQPIPNSATEKDLATGVCWVPTQRLPSYTTQQSWQKVRRWLNIDIKTGTLTVKFWKMMSMDQGACWHTCSWYQGKFPKRCVHVINTLRNGFSEARTVQLKQIITNKSYCIWVTFFPDINHSRKLPLLHRASTGIPWRPQTQWRWLRHCEWVASAWTSAEMLGIIEITADGVAKMGGQEGETTLTVVYYAFCWKRDTRKQQQTYTSSIFSCSKIPPPSI